MWEETRCPMLHLLVEAQLALPTYFDKRTFSFSSANKTGPLHPSFPALEIPIWKKFSPTGDYLCPYLEELF